MSTSEQYFRELAACLKRLPNEEREEVLRFYQGGSDKSKVLGNSLKSCGCKARNRRNT